MEVILYPLFLFKFAGTLSDGLGKTMDNRHQSEREYIRYHGATSGEHLVAGIHGLAHGNKKQSQLCLNMLKLLIYSKYNYKSYCSSINATANNHVHVDNICDSVIYRD